MKKSIIHPAFFTLIILVFSPMVAVYASSSPADSVHFCLPFDYEQWQRDHPRPAAKRLANLNVGEPRTVRMIYFLPNDRPYRADVVQRMKDEIRNIQTFYTEQMQAHGYGDKTFRFETDAQGEPVVHRVDGQHPDSHYLDDTFGSVFQEIESVFDVRENIYLVVIDNSADLIVDKAQNITGGGRASRVTKNGGFALVTGGFLFTTAAHELGHTFGLSHDFQDRAYIMSYGPEPDSLSACHAEFLTVHTYFNPVVSIEAGAPPAIELLSPIEYPAEAKSVAIRLKLQDAEGLHQVFLLPEARGPGYEVWACRNLAGKRDDEVVFEYDGYSPSHADWGKITSLSDKNVHPMRVEAVDRSGNVEVTSFQLSAETSPDERRASRIVIIAGDHQQGAPGNSLANALVVEVRDQYGQPLSGERIQFGVTEGNARLSGRYLVENAISDADGRAELTLTLGSDPETIVVRVSAPEVPECQPVLFNAIAVGTHIASPLPGDARTWHLPDRAIARLGKGRLGEGDRAVSFSPDGLCVAVASRIGVWVYELATFHELALLPTANSIYSIAFSPDGKTLALGFYEGMVELWDVATSTRIITLTRHMNTKWGTSVAFSSDGTILASMSEKEDIKLWDIETGRNIATLGTQEFRGGSLPKSISVSFSPDGTTLASSSADHEVKLWDVATGTQIATLPGHRLRVTSVAFSPDGTILASGSDDGTVKLWDVARRESIETLKGHGGKVKSVSFSRDGKTLVSGSNDTEVKLWDVTTGTAIATLSGGHTSWVTSARFSPDGTIVASGSSQDGTILLWDVATENAATFPGIGHADVGNSLAFSPDGKMLASSSEDGTPKLWDTETGRHIRSFGLRPWGIQVVAFSPDSTTLAAGSLDNTIDLWNVATGEKIASFKRGGQILSMAFSPDGTMLAAGDPKGVSLWDIATVSAASAALGGQVVSGDMAADHHISTPLGQTDWVESMAFSPDGTTLASGSHNSTFTLWDASTLAYIVTLPGGGGPASWITSLAFSPDGTTFASAGSYIFLWNVATGNGASLSRSGQVDAGNSVAFSPKGKMLATGSSGGQVKLWDVATREQIAILEGHTDKVESLSFSPYGTTLASGSEDGTILLWDMSPYIRPEVSNPDFDGNGTVGFSDFLLFVDQFGLSQGDAGYDARFDLDGDGIIGISDFLIFVNAFGKEAS